MLGIFKKEKREKLALNLQNPANQKAAIRAALNNKIPLINKGNGIFFVEIKRAKEQQLRNFLKQFLDASENCQQGVIDKNDPKIDYIVIYDKED